MAGNKVNTKGKGKEDKNKTSKDASNDDTEDIDFTLLRKPVVTSVTGFAQARKIFDIASEELKSLLSNECDLLYECKVCRNIFRSLANFISHKRVYCKEKFTSTLNSNFFKTNSLANELLKIKRVEQGYQESLKNPIEVNDGDRVPLTKDLTTILEKITNNRGMCQINPENQQVLLHKIPESSVAVYQNIHFDSEKECESMQTQVKELDNILSQDKAVLQNDGTFKIASNRTDQPESVIQISDDDDNDKSDALQCKICDVQFATRKTMRFHMKYKHLESRLVYPCPDCFDIFSTSWSVYRHLFKVHRKTAAQIRRLRESIQAKAFKMNNPPAIYEKKKNNSKTPVVQKITEEERLDQENQAWMDNMEGDGELPRCGGCGRTFERRAALAAHTYTCQPRSRALARKPSENKKIEIQIRKDYNKGPNSNVNVPFKGDANENKSSIENDPSDLKLRLKENDKNLDAEEKSTNENSMDTNETTECNDAFELTEEAKTENAPVVEEYQPAIRLPLCHQAEQNNLVAFKQRIEPEVEIDRLLCKKCDTKYLNVQELYDHMAGHLKWMRYSCKLCNYKHYEFEKLPEHVKIVHKLKGDTDFYYSTVKAIDGAEALELSSYVDFLNDTNVESRRPSRCSSDSSRVSDDSSSSSTRIESRKRKIQQNKGSSKRKKDSLVPDSSEDQRDSDLSMDKVMTIILGDMKPFEENSSDMEDIEERSQRKQRVEPTTSMASRRPIRKKTRPKNEDFEYDLSNLLKMEAQGYRESQPGNTTKSQSKKKIQPEIINNLESINKDYNGALATLSRKSVEISAASLKIAQKDGFLNTFIKPQLPKNVSKGEKGSPKKDILEDSKESNINKKIIVTKSSEAIQTSSAIALNINSTEQATTPEKDDSSTKTTSGTTEKDNSELNSNSVKPGIKIPLVPLKFRRQSLEVIKNPLVNKNITDFKKAGMKTKILVIKPINRNKDGTPTVKTPLKFQTIKLKEPNKKPLEDNGSDQMVVVKVPEDREVPRATSETNSKDKEEKSQDDTMTKLCSNDNTLTTTKLSSNDNTLNNTDDTNNELENVESVIVDKDNKELNSVTTPCTSVDKESLNQEQ